MYLFDNTNSRVESQNEKNNPKYEYDTLLESSVQCPRPLAVYFLWQLS